MNERSRNKNNPLYRCAGTEFRWRYFWDCIAVFTYVLALNWQFEGPTYLTDEIGYLSNAVFLPGHAIDGGSSYHFGYSLFLVPSFLLFSDPRRNGLCLQVRTLRSCPDT